MKIDPKLVEQWNRDYWVNKNRAGLTNHIAQKAADHALEEAAKVCDREWQLPNADLASEIRSLKGTK
jgi:hypothetical protein